MAEDMITFIGPYGTLRIPAHLLPEDPAEVDAFVAAMREEIRKPLRTPPSGPERVMATIRRDRGEFAPQQPVWLCGAANDRATAHRADWDGWADRGAFRPLAGRWNHWLMCWRQWRRAR